MKIQTVLNADQLKHEYGSFYHLSPCTSFSELDVPKDLLHLVPYALFWGISDDLDRERLVNSAPAEILQNLKWVITCHEDQLDAWLAGPLASKPPFKPAYIAYSAMRMASDFC